MITTGHVVEFRDPPFYDKGPGSIVVSFDAGATVTSEVSGDVGEHSIDVGDTVPIEYDRSHPQRAQVTWTRQSIVDDLSFTKGMTAVMGILAVVSTVGWLAGHRRARPA
ncbi:MAG TPA: hypothetical protein VFJ97_12675 [Dermatophilaceae bacterium]|nr:hypothetical protein [Dermatophilaceae bacterium]